MKTTKLYGLATLILMLFLIGCSSSEEENSINSISITVNQNAVQVGDEVVFTVKTDKNLDITSASEIYVNNTKINSKYYTPSSEGVLTVKAKYKNTESSDISLNVESLGPRFQKYVVIEDFTGTWCGWCPRVAKAIEDVSAKTKYSIAVAAHIGDNMENTTSRDLKNFLGVSGYPTAYLDRGNLWSSPETSNVSQATSITKNNSAIGLALETKLNNGDITVKAKLKFGRTYTENHKLVVLILEDGISEDQSNYTSHYNGASTITGFIHNHVLRGALTNVKGKTIDKKEAVKDNVYELEIKGKVPSTVSDTSKMSVVVLVTKKSGKNVINARYAHIGDTNNFEEK